MGRAPPPLIIPPKVPPVITQHSIYGPRYVAVVVCGSAPAPHGFDG